MKRCKSKNGVSDNLVRFENFVFPICHKSWVQSWRSRLKKLCINQYTGVYFQRTLLIYSFLRNQNYKTLYLENMDDEKGIPQVRLLVEMNVDWYWSAIAIVGEVHLKIEE